MYLSEGSELARPVGAPGLLKARVRVGANVWGLGLTSLATDVSSEMITAILPLYLVVHYGFSPLAFGAVDGIQQGLGAMVRWVGGVAGDRSGRHKDVAAFGYVLSAATRLAWLPVGGAISGVAMIVGVDRVGKGIRTAPRDALISLSATPSTLGYAFGVHRALDATGALLGPVLAFAVLSRAPDRFDLVFVASFAAAMVGLAILFLGVENVRPDEADSKPRRPSLTDSLMPLQDATFRRIVLAGSALALVSVSDAFLYLALREQAAIDAIMIPLLFASTNLCYLLAAAPMGRLADRVGRSRVFLAGHGLLLMAYLSAGWIGGAGVWLAPVALGGYYAATDGVLSALASPHLPARLRGSGLALLGTSTSVARLLASVGVGWVWTTVGPQRTLLAFGVGLGLAMALASAVMRNRDLAARGESPGEHRGRRGAPEARRDD